MDSLSNARSGAVAAKAGPTKIRWKIFLLLLSLLTINYIDRSSLSVAMPLIASEFKIGPALQGLLLSSFYWSYAPMQIPGGMLIDRFGPRAVLAGAALGWGMFQGVAALCTGWISFLVTRLGLGIAEAPISPAGGKLNAIWMTSRERGRGATILDGGAPLGAALGGLIISSLITALDSWRLAFVTAGVGTMIVGIFAWYFIRNSPREHPNINEAEIEFIEADRLKENATGSQFPRKNVLNFFAYRSMWGMTLGWMFFNALFAGLLTWMPIYLSAVYGFDIKQMGGAIFIMFFAGFIGELLGGWVADTWLAAGATPTRVFRSILAFASILATLAIYLVAQVSNPTLVVVMLSVTLFFLRWCGIYWALPALLGVRDRVGFLGGTMNLGGNIAGIGVPVAVGLIVQATGSYFYALMLFVGAGVGLFVSSVFLIDYSKKMPV